MKTIKKIFVYLFFGLSFLVRGQVIGNYVNNGGFEQAVSGPSSPTPKYWTAIDSNSFFGVLLSTNLIPYNAPLSSYTFQWPRTGNNFLISTPYCNTCSFNTRGYPRNELKSKLEVGKTYCFSMFVNLSNKSSHAISSLGACFTDNSTDTINYCTIPLTYLIPQIQNPIGNFITDTLNWVQIKGMFIANGSEQYMILGNFNNDVNSDTLFVNPYLLPAKAAVYSYDDISCIDINLPAFAGRDTTVLLGDSVFIGRESDVGIDEACMWYQLPISITPTTQALDTIAGFWIKPVSNCTFVVRQQLWCSSVKWDTVVVSISTNYVGLDKLQNLSDNISLFPNPTSGNLSISGFIAADNCTFSISNCLGQNVLNGDIIQKNNSIIIETSELESGLYQIHLKTQFGIVTKKFVKTN